MPTDLHEHHVTNGQNRKAMNNPLFAAIQKKVCLQVAVDGLPNRSLIAPHAVYIARDGSHKVDAYIARRGKNVPSNPKMQGFKIASLSDIRLTDLQFVPHENFRTDNPKYAKLISKIEVA